jgi:multicomponent Na+:H+ antiporter subunit F
MIQDSPLLAATVWAAGLTLGIGMLLALGRLVKGPSLPDRVVAADVLATMMIGALVVAAITTSQSLLLDIALAIALVVFLGTVALAMAIERGYFK